MSLIANLRPTFKWEREINQIITYVCVLTFTLLQKLNTLLKDRVLDDDHVLGEVFNERQETPFCVEPEKLIEPNRFDLILRGSSVECNGFVARFQSRV